MNEQTKNYVRIGAIVLGVIILGAAGWLLFRDIPNNSGSAGDVTNQLKDTKKCVASNCWFSSWVRSK